jgi:hypothetical protein
MLQPSWLRTTVLGWVHRTVRAKPVDTLIRSARIVLERLHHIPEVSGRQRLGEPGRRDHKMDNDHEPEENADL